jgi:hypothetical protein
MEEARKWRRHFMNAERERRKQKRRAEAELFEKELEGICLKREIRLLKAQQSRDRHMIVGQHGVIQRLHKLLREHGIPEPVSTQVGSFKTCRARDDEICPLSLQPINSSDPPYDNDNSIIDVEPRKPHHKCAELLCGHRFNALWLLFHFVARSTFRCPVCRSGHEDFHFQMEQLPKGLVDKVKDVMNRRGN